MFNFVNRNPFGQKIESTMSTGQESKQQQQQQKDDEEKKYLEDDDSDEVTIGNLPTLSEEEILYMVKDYIEKLKSEHSDNIKTIQKLDKFLDKFNVKKFMKNNPNMNASDFYMVMFNETIGIIGS